MTLIAGRTLRDNVTLRDNISSHVKLMGFQAHLLQAPTGRMFIPASNNCIKLARLPDVDWETFYLYLIHVHLNL